MLDAVGDPARAPTTATPTPARAVFRDGWVRMGDLGYLDADGYLYLVDRDSDVVKSGAYKVSTLHVEAALHEHPAVADAAVLGLPHPVMGATVAAAVVLRTRRRWPTACAPSSPTGSRRTSCRPGCCRRRAAPQRRRQGAQGRAAGTVHRRGRPATGRRAAHADRGRARPGSGARCCGGPRSVVDDDFFALGGDSLRATRLAALGHGRDGFGVDVPVVAAPSSRPVLAAPGRASARSTPLGHVRPTASPETAIRPRPRWTGGDGMPLSVARRRACSAWMWATGEPRDVGPISVAIRIRDELDPELLDRACGCWSRRHEALRTVFAGRDGRHRARVLGRLPAGGDVRRRRRADAEPATHAGSCPRRPGGAASTSPPVRWSGRWWSGSTADDHVLGLAVHHLVFDGASMGVLLRETRAGLLRRCAPDGRPLPAAAAGRSLPAGGALDPRAAGRRTRALLATPARRRADRHLEPFRGRRRGRSGCAATQLEFALARRRSPTGLRRAAAAPGRDPVHGDRGVLGRRCCPGCTGAPRHRADVPGAGPDPARQFEPLIGCLVQSLLLRVDTSRATRPSTELLDRDPATALAAIDHQHYPFAEFYLRLPNAAWLRVESWGGQAHFPGLDSEPFELPRALDADWPTPERRARPAAYPSWPCSNSRTARLVAHGCSGTITPSIGPQWSAWPRC